MTPRGAAAERIAEWAWQDPPGRVDDAMRQVGDLYLASSDDREKSEISGTATMLSRLAGTLEPTPDLEPAGVAAGSTETYGGTDSLAGQVLGLAAWQHERRGPHGKWMGSSGADATSRSIVQRQAKNNRLAADRRARLDAARQAAAERTQQASRAPSAPAVANKASAVAARAQQQALTPDILKSLPLLPGETEQRHEAPLTGETQRENLIHEQFLHQEVEPVMAAHAENAITAAAKNVEKRLADVAKATDTAEGHSAVLKAATEGSIALAGGLLAYLGTKIGIPDLAAIAGSSGLVLIQVIIEFFKRL